MIFESSMASCRSARVLEDATVTEVLEPVDAFVGLFRRRSQLRGELDAGAALSSRAIV
jgi:hypothetical protein